jgi:hypothetical protein
MDAKVQNQGVHPFARKAGITEAVLCEAIRGVERGLIAADLGSSVIKQRIARPGQGKSGGFQALIVFRAAHRPSSFTVRQERKDNIEKDELVAGKKLASELLASMMRRTHESWTASIAASASKACL